VARKSEPVEEAVAYDNTEDVETLVRAEMELDHLEGQRREAMKEYADQIKAVKVTIGKMVRRLNGEDEQLGMEV